MLGSSTRRILFVSAAISASSLAAHAQGEIPAAQAASAPAKLESVMVTARRKLEPMQETPVAVTLVSKRELEAWQVSSMTGVAESSPNVVLQRQAGSASTIQYNIRGISSGGSTPQLDAGVAMYLDGLYMGRAGNTLLSVWDIERVEVLRGPQGMLFGRNATGGAVNIITNAPQGTFGGTIKQSLGNYGLSSTQLAVDTPSVAGISARLALSHQEHLPYTRNTAPRRTVDFGAPFGALTTSSGFDDERSDSAKLALRYSGVKGLTLDYKLMYLDWRGDKPARQLSSLDPADAAAIKFDQQALLPGGMEPVLDKQARDAVPAGLDTGGQFRSLAQGLIAQYRVDDRHRLRYSLSHSGYDSFSGGTGVDGNAFVDPGGSGQATFLSFALGKSHQSMFSQELQWTGGAGHLDWLLGLFNFRERAYVNTPVMSLALGQSRFGPQRPITDLDYLVGSEILSVNRSTALYARTDLTVGDWVLSTGLRSSMDRRDEDLIRGGLASSNAGLALKYRDLNGQYTGHKTDLDLSARLRITPTINSYLRYATGYLSGGVLLGKPFGREDVQSLEAGLKADLTPQLRVNATLFMMRRRNLQAQVFDASVGGIYMLNAGTGRSRGLELETQWQPDPHLRLSASYGFFALHSENGVRSVQPRQTAFLAGAWTFAPLSGGARPEIQLDTSWRSAVYRPECPLGATSDPLLGCAQLQNADWALDRSVRMRARAVVGLRAGLAQWRLPGQMTGRAHLWIRNLANSREAEYVFSLGNKSTLSSYQPPRTLGLDLAIDF